MNRPISQTLARDCLSRGLAALKAGRAADAVGHLDGALALDSGMAAAHGARGAALGMLARHPEALLSFDYALRLDARSAATWINRGNSLNALCRYAEAIESYDRAIALDAGRPAAWCNRAAALRGLDRHEEALASLDRALLLDRANVSAWSDRGVTLREMGRCAEAMESFDRGLAVDPSDARTRFNRGVLQLLLGDLAGGWDGWEVRQQLPALGTPWPRGATLWDGVAPLQGRTLLLLAEQGIGDSIQFCRFVPLLAERGARIVLSAPPPLLRLLTSLNGAERVVEAAETAHDADVYCGLLSVAHRLRTSLELIPAAVPYLAAAPQDLERWRQRLGPAGRPRIGLACSGNPQHGFDRHRSIRLAEFAPLAQWGAELHLVQNDLRAHDEPALTSLGVVDHRRELLDLAETAALLQCMDAVVSVDTSIAHLAGALARPLYLLLPSAPDWRWLLERSDSPWYPSARLFRQPAPGQWEPALARLCDALRQTFS